MAPYTSSPLGQWLARQPDYADPDAPTSSLPALYADLSAHRQSNRTSFETSVAWWKRILSTACMEGVLGASSNSIASKGKETERQVTDRLILHVDQTLWEGLTIEEVGRPLGLGTVVQELRVQRHLVRLSHFLASRVPIHAPDRAGPTSSSSLPRKVASLAAAPLVWAMSQLSLSLGYGEASSDQSEQDWRLAKGAWVVYDNVEALAEAVMTRHWSGARLSPIDSLFSWQTFVQQVVAPAMGEQSGTSSAITPSQRDVDVLLRYLTRDRHLAVVDGQSIKLAHREDQSMADAAISEAEHGIINVRDTHAQVERQIADIERQIAERQERISRCLQQNAKTQAMSYLRSKKNLEALLERRTATLETLHGVMIKIEQAASDVEIMKAYETSTESLKTLLKDARLQPDRIDASMDAMQETLASADEVRQAIDVGQQGMRQAAGVTEPDDAEMEAELAALQKEVEQEEQEDKEDDLEAKMPSVPSHAVPATAAGSREGTAVKTETRQEQGALPETG